MALESKRYALGIIEDGNGFESDDAKASTLRTLLPLEWEYMFVLCSTKLYKKALDSGKPVTTLANVIDLIDPGTLCGYLVLDFANWLLKYSTAASGGEKVVTAAQSIGPLTDNTSLEMDYAQLTSMLEAYSATVDAQTHTETVERMFDWDANLRKLRTAIRASQKLSAVEREVLLSGVRELRMDIMSSQWLAKPTIQSSPPTPNDSRAQQS